MARFTEVTLAEVAKTIQEMTKSVQAINNSLSSLEQSINKNSGASNNLASKVLWLNRILVAATVAIAGMAILTFFYH